VTAIPPIVRYLVLCEECRRDPANPRKISAINLMGYVQPAEGLAYPFEIQEIVALGMLTEGRGSARFRIEVVKDFDQPIYRGVDQSVTFGSDPLQLVVLTFRILRLRLPSTGVYEFRLLCDDVQIAIQPLRAR